MRGVKGDWLIKGTKFGLTCGYWLNITGFPFSSPEAAFLLISTKNRNLRPDPMFEHAPRIRFVLLANQICQT